MLVAGCLNPNSSDTRGCGAPDSSDPCAPDGDLANTEACTGSCKGVTNCGAPGDLCCLSFHGFGECGGPCDPYQLCTGSSECSVTGQTCRSVSISSLSLTKYPDFDTEVAKNFPDGKVDVCTCMNASMCPHPSLPPFTFGTYVCCAIPQSSVGVCNLSACSGGQLCASSTECVAGEICDSTGRCAGAGDASSESTGVGAVSDARSDRLADSALDSQNMSGADVVNDTLSDVSNDVTLEVGSIADSGLGSDGGPEGATDAAASNDGLADAGAQ